MSTAIANGSSEVERKAASDANAVQDGVNLIAIVGCFHRHLRAMRDSGVYGDNLNNHPVSIAFTSKLIAFAAWTTRVKSRLFAPSTALRTGNMLSTR